jgi:hypothetical protein
MMDHLPIAGLILGAIIIVAAAANYDPEVEVFPGRTMRQSQAEITLAVWDIPEPGRKAKWINPDPKPSNDPFFEMEHQEGVSVQRPHDADARVH